MVEVGGGEVVIPVQHWYTHGPFISVVLSTVSLALVKLSCPGSGRRDHTS